MKIIPWVKAHKVVVGLAAAGGVAGLALYMKSRAAAAGAASATPGSPTAPATAAATGTIQPASYSSNGYNTYSGLVQPQIAKLSNEIAKLRKSQAAQPVNNGTPYAPPVPVPPPAQGTPAPSPVAPPVQVQAPAPSGAGSYTVRSGDSLWGIATSQTGSGANWQSIYNANRGVIGGNPNLIYPGQRLTIPAGL